MGWSKLQALILDLDIDNILADNDYLTALQARCVLCGRLSSKPGGVLQHLQQEHQELLSLSRDLEDRLQNEALASGRQCKCGNKYTKRGHKCMIYAQLAVLYHALQPRSVAPSVSADLQVSAPSTSEPTTFWTRESWRTWLSTTCSVCQIKVELDQLHQHLQQAHAHMYAEALGQLERCTSPDLFCCNFCLKAEEIVDCPVALNLAYHILLHADDRIWSGRTDGSDRGHLRLNASGGRKAAGSQENQRADGKPSRDIRSLLLGAHRPSSTAPDDPDTSSGGLHPVPSDHRHIPDVLAVCTVGHSPAADEEITGMETSHGEPNGQTGLEECALSDHCATTPRPLPQDCHLESRIRDLERGYHTSGDHGARVMALLGVESKGETPGSHGQDRSFYDHHAELDRGAGGYSIAWGVGPQTQVPQTGKQGWGETSGQSLATAIASQEGENPRDPDAFDRFLNMVSCHGQGQTTHQQGESCRGPADQSVQQPVQAEALAGWLLSLRLSNEGHQCYQNAIVVSLLWCMTQMGSAMWQDFGQLYPLIEELFTQESLWINLQRLSCFDAFLSAWGTGSRTLGNSLPPFFDGLSLCVCTCTGRDGCWSTKWLRLLTKVQGSHHQPSAHRLTPKRSASNSLWIHGHLIWECPQHLCIAANL